MPVSRHHRVVSSPPSTRYQGLPRDPLCWIVALLAVCVPWVAVSPDSRQWHGGKSLAVECGAALLLTALLARPVTRRTLRSAGNVLHSGPMPFLIALTLWAALSSIWSVAPTFSALELREMFSGLLIYGVVASQARAPGGALLLLDALIVAAAVVSVSGLVDIGAGGTAVARGVFHDHMLFGAFIMLLLPVLLAAGFSAPPAHRYAAQSVSALSFAALAVSQTRSAWIGEAAALTTFAVLFFWSGAGRSNPVLTAGERQRRKALAIPYVILGVGLLIGFLTLAPQRDAVKQRIQSLTTTVVQGREASVEWRFGAWRGACLMIMDRPLLGRGVGCYPACQQPFTQVGEPPAVVQAEGPTIFDQAHDSYLQMAVDLGLPGVLLWLAALTAALVMGLRAIPGLPADGPRAWTVIGGLSSLVGQVVDALANPAWQFGEVMLYFWVILGLTMAAACGPDRETPTEERPTLPIPLRLIQSVAAIAAGGWLVIEAIGSARLLPAPHL